MNIYIKLCVTKQSETPTPILRKPLSEYTEVLEPKQIESDISPAQQCGKVKYSVSLSPSYSSLHSPPGLT